MEDKNLDILFAKINLEDEYRPIFQYAKLLKILVDEDHFFFEMENDKMLEASTFSHLEKLIDKSFKESHNYLVIKPEAIDYTLVNDYFGIFLDKLAIKALHHFKTSNIVVDETIQIEVINKVEYDKLNKYINKMNEQFERYGFHKEVEIVINEKQRETIQNEIKEDSVIKIELTKEVSPIIMGDEIKTKKITELDQIISEEANVTIEGCIFGLDFFESQRSDFKVITIKVTDEKSSIYAKVITKDKELYSSLEESLKAGKWYRIRGYVKHDNYARELVLNVRDITSIASKEVVKKDEEEIKRVELHAHTTMSQMDGVVESKDLINRAKKWGHEAIAITDHDCTQGYPEAYKMAKDIKVIYGVEVSMVDDTVDIVLRPNDLPIMDTTYVVFDFETTGFNATAGDSIIEIGAVKLKDGEIIETYQTLVNPGKPLNAKITEITNITNEMLKGQISEEEAIKDFREWIGDLPLVAHNAKFDVSFLESAYYKYGYPKLSNTVIDTLELSRTLDMNQARHSLSAIVKRYEVEFDESGHHRADYDAKATALVLNKMLKRLSNQNINSIKDINNLVSKDELHKFGNLYHVILLAKNNVGLKNLFRIVSLANTKYLYKTPRMLRSEIENNREGLFVGSACYNGEVFSGARGKTDEEMKNIIKFYDYVELQPPTNYSTLIDMGDFNNYQEIITHLKKIIRLADENGKMIVATGDVHHLDEKDKIAREIIANQKVPGGGRHPLARDSIKQLPSQHFRTTREMLDAFAFLGEEKAKEIVVTNSNIIASQIEKVVVIRNSEKPLSPKMENSDKIVRDLTYNRAHELYGELLPDIVKDRIDKELNGIIGGGFDVIYLIAQKLVKKSNDDGYLVGSRGSVGSSFVAHMMGITEVNALPAHYRCPNCKTSLFELHGEVLGAKYPSGYDLPDLKCSCGTWFQKEGQDMPFATFLGFNADKVPDIDLNFSGDYQAKAHDYTKELFGEDYVFRAGTIGTVAEKTAFGYVKGYMEDKNVQYSVPHQEFLASKCTGVKRTTGQHPGGIVVIPNYMDVLDFTPFQYPANDTTSKWYTTHFDYHPMELDLLKLDILGHDDPTVLKMLGDLSGIDILTIPLDDKKVLSIFKSPEVLGVTKDQILCEVGTLGIPEFGTKFVIDMLIEIRPETFADLVKISGLSHGTDVWKGNAEELIKSNTCAFSEVIGCRDDIMVYLSYHGIEPKDAFKIMEFVRKGKPTKDKEEWNNVWIPKMRQHNINDWYMDSCTKIKYMFPKAHATAYVMMACRVAWFKVYKPLLYYAAYLSIRATDFDIETMIKGYDSIKAKILELNNKGFDRTNKENEIYDTLQIALEMTARGFKFTNIDLKESHATKFIIKDDKTLIPPFKTIEGLGDVVANKIIEERAKGEFISIEDLQKRGKVSQTTIDKLKSMGVLQDLPESSQLSLF